MPSRTVLCVDDNRKFVDNVREILEENHYVVLAASSCAEALITGQRGFAIAIVDLRLPDGEGTALAVRLREMAPDAQVILLTGFASLESAAAAVRAGAWAYLVKPCAGPDLLKAVDQAAAQVKVLQDRRELQRRAQVAEKLAAIGTLAAGLSHEIKNPLNAATLQLRVAESRLDRYPAELQPAIREPLRLVEDEIVRLNHLLEEFLAFARPRELDPIAFDLAPVLARVLGLLSVEAEQANVRLEQRFSAPLATLGEEERLQQVVINLVRNAIQATPAGGFVRVIAESVEGGVSMAVEDSGPGIPEALRNRIFEPFFTTKAAGSGLGLPLVHSIVEQHRGSIVVEQTATGGARFVVTLPRPALEVSK
jgi:signal transduction histidine kinase